MLDQLVKALQNSRIDKNLSFKKIFVDFVAFGTVYKKEKRYSCLSLFFSAL
jgi:hypothetical protein